MLNTKRGDFRLLFLSFGGNVPWASMSSMACFQVRPDLDRIDHASYVVHILLSKQNTPWTPCLRQNHRQSIPDTYAVGPDRCGGTLTQIQHRVS